MIKGNNILFIGHDLSDKGGIATLENQYAKIIKPYKHISIFKLDSIANKLYIFIKGIIIMFWELMKDEEIKIVHIQTASGVDFYRNCVPLLISKLFRKKIILHVHGGYFAEFCKNHIKTSLFIINKVDRLLVVSDFLYRKLVSLEIKVPIIRVYNILEEPIQLELNEDKKDNVIMLGFLGAINNNKRIFDLLNLFVEHPDLHKYYRLKIGGVGDIDRLNFIISNYKLESLVTYEGWINGDNKRSFFESIDILIQPSDFESFGLSIAEAMSYGKIAIGTNVGGIPEIIRNNINGFLIEKGDFDGLYNLLMNLKERKNEFEIMGIAAKESVIQFYSNNIEKRLKELYVEIINN